jgi:hypothetical protein
MFYKKCLECKREIFLLNQCPAGLCYECINLDIKNSNKKYYENKKKSIDMIEKNIENKPKIINRVIAHIIYMDNLNYLLEKND